MVRQVPISTRTNLYGYAYDPDGNFLKYTLGYRRAGSDPTVPFTVFWESYEAVTADNPGLLGVLDPSMMENGLYEVIAVAYDTAGRENINKYCRYYTIEGNQKIGNFTISFNDLTESISTIPINVTRTYDSRVKLPGLWSRLETGVSQLGAPGNPAYG